MFALNKIKNNVVEYNLNPSVVSNVVKNTMTTGIMIGTGLFVGSVVDYIKNIFFPQQEIASVAKTFFIYLNNNPMTVMAIAGVAITSGIVIEKKTGVIGKLKKILSGKKENVSSQIVSWKLGNVTDIEEIRDIVKGLFISLEKNIFEKEINQTDKKIIIDNLVNALDTTTTIIDNTIKDNRKTNSKIELIKKYKSFHSIIKNYIEKIAEGINSEKNNNFPSNEKHLYRLFLPYVQNIRAYLNLVSTTNEIQNKEIKTILGIIEDYQKIEKYITKFFSNSSLKDDLEIIKLKIKELDLNIAKAEESSQQEMSY